MPFLPLHACTRIYYELEGQGEPVALLNGILMNTKAWFFQKQALSHYQVLSHDFFGQGQSQRGDEGCSLAGHAHHLLLLLDELEIKTIHLVGVSYGGEVALQFALHYPERTASLLVAAAVSEISPLLSSIAKAWERAAQFGDGEAFLDILLPFIYSNTFLTHNREWLDKRRALFLSQVNDGFFQDFLCLLKSFQQLHLTPFLHQLVSKTLVVAGEEDILKPPFYSHLIAQNIEGSRLEIIPHCGHAIPIEAPEAFNSLLLDFLKECSC